MRPSATPDSGAWYIFRIIAFNDSSHLDDVDWRGNLKVRWDVDGSLSEWLKEKDVERIGEPIVKNHPKCADLRLTVVPRVNGDQQTDQAPTPTLKISQDATDHLYAFAAAEFGASVAGDMQWIGKVQEITDAKKDLDYAKSTIALWKRGERDFVDMARIAQEKGAAALIIYNNDDAEIEDLPKMARVDDAASSDSQREYFIKIPVIMVRLRATEWDFVLSKVLVLDAQISLVDGLELKRLLAERDANVIATLPSSVPDSRSMVLRLPLYMPTSAAPPEALPEPYVHIVDLSSDRLSACLQEEFVWQAFEDEGLGAHMVPLCDRMDLSFGSCFGSSFGQNMYSLEAWVDQHLSTAEKRALEVVIGRIHQLKRALGNCRLYGEPGGKLIERFNVALRTFPGALLKLKTQVRCLNICCDELEEIPELLGLHFHTAPYTRK
jgi:hypothetical protein